MGSEAGFEYHWRLSMGDADKMDPKLISEAKATETFPGFASKLKPGYRIFVFEFKTDFILARMPFAPNTFMDSEIFYAIVFEFENTTLDPIMLHSEAFERLSDYWMTDDEIIRLVDEAIDFARQNASSREVNWASLVVVGLEVRTAQQEGESNEAAMARVIRAQYLVPMSYLPFTYSLVESAPKIYNIPGIFIRDIRKKVDKIDGMCGICSRNMSVSIVASKLPRCGHTFHSGCICLWLEGCNRCPSCQTTAFIS
ncbi:E3 ubiquitin-protein ligase AIP2 [Striga hermonthica]|uniref:RING-type E3 ubiquitin transferase n=1 Tax=Striga hermonthica TaxID=68872 RepID=A0A9N7RLZ5_STRHE|nr:E3 ubiquitin-protein ligase AIP2 [Striga hermonthica]